MWHVRQAKIARLMATAFVITAIGALAVLSARDNHAEAGTTITVEVSNFKFCTSGQSPCPNSPLDTTVAASVGNTISFDLIDGVHTATSCTDDTFTDCSGALFDFGTGAGDWLIPGGADNSDVFFRCNVHPSTMRALIVVGSPATPTPVPTPTPFSVGGIAAFPDIDESPANISGSSGGSSIALAAIAGLLAALAVLAAGAWYARRRSLR